MPHRGKHFPNPKLEIEIIPRNDTPSEKHFFLLTRMSLDWWRETSIELVISVVSDGRTSHENQFQRFSIRNVISWGEWEEENMEWRKACLRSENLSRSDEIRMILAEFFICGLRDYLLSHRWWRIILKIFCMSPSIHLDIMESESCFQCCDFWKTSEAKLLTHDFVTKDTSWEFNVSLEREKTIKYKKIMSVVFFVCVSHDFRNYRGIIVIKVRASH